MTTAPVDIGSLISCTPGTVGGKPRLAGTRISVHFLAGLHAAGMSPEEIVEQYPHLDLARVHAGLAFYFANKERIDRKNAAEEAFAEEMARRFPKGLRNEPVPQELLDMLPAESWVEAASQR
jgi:uncharacterized protein (DUF433 family)